MYHSFFYMRILYLAAREKSVAIKGEIKKCAVVLMHRKKVCVLCKTQKRVGTY